MMNLTLAISQSFQEALGVRKAELLMEIYCPTKSLRDISFLNATWLAPGLQNLEE